MQGRYYISGHNIKKFGATNFQQRNDQSPEYFVYTIPNDDSNIVRSGYNKGSDYVVYKWGHDAKIGLKALAELLFEAHKKGINVNTVIKDLKDLFSGDEQLKNDLEKIPYGQKQYSELQEAFNKLPDNSALLD